MKVTASGQVSYKVNGTNLEFNANGGVENHVAQIAQGGAYRVWAESETGGEAYIPLAAAKRQRSLAILDEVAARFGYVISKSSAVRMADGGILANSNPSGGVVQQIQVVADVSRLRSVADLEEFFSNLRQYARQKAGVH